MYQRFDEKYTVFCRTLWDPIIKDAEAPFANVPKDHIMNNDKGFTRLDYAFYTAAWTPTFSNGTTHSDDNTGLYSWLPLNSRTKMLYDMPAWKPEEWSPEEVSQIVKTTARFFGASMAGIAEVDERWLYSNRIYSDRKPGPARQDTPDNFFTLMPRLRKSCLMAQ